MVDYDAEAQKDYMLKNDLGHYIDDSVKDEVEVEIATPFDYMGTFSELIVRGADYSAKTLTDAFEGYMMGVCTMIFAASGLGKTTFIHGEVFNLMKQGHKVAVISTEERAEVLIENLVWAGTGKKLPRYSTGDKQMDQCLMAERQQAINKVFKDGLLYFPKNVTKLKLDNIVAFIKKCAEQDIKHIFLDNITALAAKDTGDKDTWKKIEFVTSTIADLSRDLKVHITIIGHTNADKKVVNQYSIKGSQSLANMIDNIMVMYPAETPTVRGENNEILTDYRIVEVLKSRHNGQYRGMLVGLRYDASTKQLTECSEIIGAEPVDRTSAKSMTRQDAQAIEDPFSAAAKKKEEAGDIRDF